MEQRKGEREWGQRKRQRKERERRPREEKEETHRGGQRGKDRESEDTDRESQ